MKTTALIDFILPVVLGLAVFGALTWMANYVILHPAGSPIGSSDTVWAGATNESKQVSATVKVQNVAVTVTDGSIDYGVLATGGTQTPIFLGDTQSGENTGNVTEDFNIMGSDTASWTLGTDGAGVEIYWHEYTVNASTYTSIDQGTYKTMRNSVSSEGTIDDATFDFRITTPTSTTQYATQAADLTVQAVVD